MSISPSPQRGASGRVARWTRKAVLSLQSGELGFSGGVIDEGDQLVAKGQIDEGR